MKRFIHFAPLIIFCLLIPTNCPGQQKEIPNQNKWGYIDTDFILSKMPEYQKIQKEVDQLANSWSEDFKQRFLEIDSLYNDFQEEAVLLSPEEKDQRLTELKIMEDSLSIQRMQVFGFNGEFFQKKKEMLKTVQDRLFDAIEIVAKEFELQTLFDKSGDENIIYVNPIHNYSDYVLEKLGLGDPNDVVR